MTSNPSERSFREFEQAGWDDSAVVTQYEKYISKLTTQSNAALLDAASVGAGSRVLDVATGAGHLAAAAARRGADATGIDFSAAQVGLARRRYPELRFEQADAEALPFEAGVFDAVINAFGMGHFPQPEVALREAFRVTRPGGRIAFAVWDIPERAIGFGAIFDAVRIHGSLDTGLPAGPNPFLLSDPAQSAEALRRAGFVSTSCRQVPQVWQLAEPDDLFRAVTEGSVRMAATIGSQTSQTREAIRAALRETVMTYRRGDHFEVPMPAIVAWGSKS